MIPASTQLSSVLSSDRNDAIKRRGGGRNFPNTNTGQTELLLGNQRNRKIGSNLDKRNPKRVKRRPKKAPLGPHRTSSPQPFKYASCVTQLESLVSYSMTRDVSPAKELDDLRAPHINNGRVRFHDERPQEMDSEPKNSIPKSNCLRDADRFTATETETSPIPLAPASKSFLRKRQSLGGKEEAGQDRNHRHEAQTSPQYSKQESRTDEDMSAGQRCQESRGQKNDVEVTQQQGNNDSKNGSSIGKQEELCHVRRRSRTSSIGDDLSSTCATWRSVFPSLLSSSFSSRAVAAEVPVDLHRRAPRKRAASGRHWYERSDREKGLVVPEKPSYLMSMVFFDSDMKSDEPLSDTLPSSDPDAALNDVSVGKPTNPTLPDALHINGVKLDRRDSKEQSNDDSRLRLSNEHSRGHSPASTPETLGSHSQEKETEHAKR